MSRQAIHRILTVTGVVLLVAVVAAGCGRRAQLADVGSQATLGPTTTTLSEIRATEVTTPPAPAEPAPSASAELVVSPTPTATPVASPDLASIEALISGLDSDLANDATADTDEGNPQ